MRLNMFGTRSLAARIWQLSVLELVAALFAVSLLSACGGGSATSRISQPPPPPACGASAKTPPFTPKVGGNPPPAASGLISAQFFAVNDTTPTDPPGPTLSIGTLSHPVPLAWQTIEQSCGVYDFSLFDGFADIAPKDANGTALLVMTLGKTPPWALPVTGTSSCKLSQAGNSTGCSAPPDNIQDWTNFVTALVNHYNGTTAPHIKYYEIWNEADQLNYWIGTPAQMEQLAAAAYPIIKQDPNSFVVGPSVSGNVHGSGPDDPINWLTSFLSAGGNSLMDVASFHGFVYSLKQVPYPLPTTDCSATDPNCGGAITAQVAAYRAALDVNGMTNNPIFNTEGGFEGATIDPDTGAAWLAQYYALQAGLSDSDNLQLVSWFTWGAQDGQLEINHVLTPVGTAYNQVFSWVVGRTFTSPCSNPNNGPIWTCTLTGSNGYQAEIKWDSSQTCVAGICSSQLQAVPSIYVNYKDLAGGTNVITSSTVPVGLKPILLENQ